MRASWQRDASPPSEVSQLNRIFRTVRTTGLRLSTVTLSHSSTAVDPVMAIRVRWGARCVHSSVEGHPWRPDCERVLVLVEHMAVAVEQVDNPRIPVT